LTNRRKNGTIYHEEMRIAPVRDSNGATTGYIAIKHDVTEQRAAEEHKRFLAAIVENSEDSIISCTPDGIVLTFNRGAEAIFGYSAARSDRAAHVHVGASRSSGCAWRTLPSMCCKAIEFRNTKVCACARTGA
jgi:PAS domain-containing protein